MKVFDYLTEYGLRLFLYKLWNKLHHLQFVDVIHYKKWTETHFPDEQELELEKDSLLPDRPLVSILVPTYNTQRRYLDELVRSIQGQTYDNWELCIADGNSSNEDTRCILNEIEQKDPRIHVRHLVENKGISENTNAAAANAKGDILVFADHDDVLTPNAIYEIVSAFIATEEDMVYSDEDKMDSDSRYLYAPNFKPDFSLEYLCCTNYMCHITGIKS